ncbi:MAG: hypothetical protein XD60_1307 [Acetothermia bacterium 64_32]|nr:MAG: hypothetical protein XD60_1307 [Acetothermia bacterium 64_32]
MSFLVDNPILNSPFEEPTRYWAYEEGQPVLKEGRWSAGGPAARWSWSTPSQSGSRSGGSGATPAFYGR